MRSKAARVATMTGIVAALTACASVGGTSSESTDPSGTSGQGSVPATDWPVRSRQHVDLWLHGFAMIQDDTTQVPYFRRGYKADMQDLKRRSNVTTQLDANVGSLRNRIAINPSLVNAQFVPLYFESLDDMVRALDVFERADGNPRAAGNQETAELIAILAGYFPLPADRDWARLFTQSLRDENTRF